MAESSVHVGCGTRQKPGEGYIYAKAKGLTGVRRPHSGVAHTRWIRTGANECIGERAEDDQATPAIIVT
jgi:hypothetical protein